MRFSTPNVLDPIVLGTASDRHADEIAGRFTALATTESSKQGVVESNHEATSPLLKHLRTIPGVQFAMKQIEYLRLTFNSLVSGTTSMDADRVSASLKNLVSTLTEEGSSERDFHVLGGIMN
jgi:hypothetical protein